MFLPFVGGCVDITYHIPGRVRSDRDFPPKPYCYALLVERQANWLRLSLSLLTHMLDRLLASKLDLYKRDHLGRITSSLRL